MIYLDNAATTKMDPRVLDAMMPYMTDEYGNAGSTHAMGRRAADAVAKARAQVAGLIGADPDQIIFTSSGSEANALVFKGLENYLRKTGKTHIVVSEIEHESVLRAAMALQENTKCEFYVYTVPVNHKTEQVDKRVLLKYLDSDTKIGLVSIMAVNNEVGIINPIFDIAKHCKERGILFHTDYVQAAGYLSDCMSDLPADFLSLSAHKIHGPKGCGALYCRDKSILSPIINGGSVQEFGVRGGTENVAGIVGFGRACEIFCSWDCFQDITPMSYKFTCTLEEECEELGIRNLLHRNIINEENPKILSLRFDGIDAETLLLMLDSRGVYVSAGSACTAHEQTPSHVLLACGLTEEEARNSVRISFSGMNTEEEVIEAAKIIAECVFELSQMVYEDERKEA